MDPALPSPPALERLVRLCLVFSRTPAQIRLVDAILRADTACVDKHIDAIAIARPVDDFIYPMILQLAVDHATPQVLARFSHAGATAATMSHSPPVTRMGSGPRVMDVEDICAWRLSTARCVDLVESGMLRFRTDLIERLLLLADPAGFDQVMSLVLRPTIQPDLLAQPGAPLPCTWDQAQIELQCVGHWMAAWHMDPALRELLPGLHPIIYSQGQEIQRRWEACVDAMLAHHHPAATPAASLQDMLTSPGKIRIGLEIPTPDRSRIMASILRHAMLKANASPAPLPETALSISGQILRYDWMHALLLCGFEHAHFPRDPLCLLLGDIGSSLQAAGRRTRLCDELVHLYATLARQLMVDDPERIAALPSPIASGPAIHVLNDTISRMTDAAAHALGGSLVMHSSTPPAPATPARRV